MSAKSDLWPRIETLKRNTEIAGDAERDDMKEVQRLSGRRRYPFVIVACIEEYDGAVVFNCVID